MYIVDEKDEYSEVDLLDYDCLIKKAKKRFNVNFSHHLKLYLYSYPK